MLVNVDRGRTEGIALSKTLEELDAGHRSFVDQRDDFDDEPAYPRS